MTGLRQALYPKSMNGSKHSWSQFAFGGLGGLATLNALLLGQFLLMSRQQLANLEMGFLGAFIVFGVLYSGCYLCVLVLVCAPWFYFTRNKASGIRRWLEILFGGLLFMAGIPVLSRLFFGSTSTYSMAEQAGLGLIAGFVTFAVARGFND
jgi:hypothetical protein